MSTMERVTTDIQLFAELLKENPVLGGMLLFVPLGIASHYLSAPPQYVFILNFVGIIPLAWLIGQSTEDVSSTLGETAGGLLNASFGNIVEMLLCIAGIRNGEVAVVQCTLLGSVISNLLLVLGCSFLAGGLCYPMQKYSRAGATTQCALLALSVLAVGLPTIYTTVLKEKGQWVHMVTLSRWASVLLLIVYFAYIWFQLKTHAWLFEDPEGEGEEGEEGEGDGDQPTMSTAASTALLAVSTTTTSFATEFLISSIQGTVTNWGLSKGFIGIILLPIIGNAAEHYTAIKVAMQNKMDLALGVAAGSSCQMTLLVTPFAVLLGAIYDVDMSLNFHSFQFAVLLFSVFLVNSILTNGYSNWLEGYILLATYFVISLMYFYESPDGESLATKD